MGGDEEILPGPWELHRNWRRWLGWDLRRRIYDTAYDWSWQYARSKSVAREMLHRAYGEGMPRRSPDAAKPHWWDTPLSR